MYGIKRPLFLFSVLFTSLIGCKSVHLPQLSTHKPSHCYYAFDSLIAILDTLPLPQREEWIKKEILAGNVPDFFNTWEKIVVDTVNAKGTPLRATYYVSRDYLSIGCDDNFFRVPLTPQTAQSIANHFNSFLPTRKMVDDIYRQAAVQLAPVPFVADRERVSTFYRHHQAIEAQRRGKQGLIAGIKKDVVISNAVMKATSPNRVAIYGWHKTDGIPIQPLYVGHVDTYVDYSHGIRLVYEKMKVNGKWMHFREVVKDRDLSLLLCDEEACDFVGYR